MLSFHTTNTLSPAEAICGSDEVPLLRLRLNVLLILRPLSVTVLKLTSSFPVLLSFHTTNTLSPAQAICGSDEVPLLRLRLNVLLILRPLSVTVLKLTSSFPVLLSFPVLSSFPVLLSLHTTNTLSPAASYLWFR